MNNETETFLINNSESEAVKLTDEQVSYIYNELSDIDKTSTENLATAEKETESSNYTTEDNTIIEATEEIPGVSIIPENVADSIKETKKDIQEVLSEYDLDDESIIQMLKIIDEYKAGNKSSLYLKLPKKIQNMVDGLIASEIDDKSITMKELARYRNSTATMLIDSFISDAKISAAVDDFNSEMSSTIDEMNSEYDNMIGDAVDSVFNRIEEIRAEDPEQAKRIESIKSAFDSATTFEKQLEFAKHISANKFNKFLTRYKDDVYYFNKRVNNNSIGVKVYDIDIIVPVIKYALPQYSEDDIKKFIICICRTIENIDDLNGIAYEYRMINSIYKYKFVPIDEKGEIIFENISKVIDAILS